MKKKSIVLRELANRDIEEACSHYLDEGAAVVALDFIDTLEAAFAGIARHPGAGSSRYARELNLPGLRSRVVTNYPFMIFYRELDNHIDVWRAAPQGPDRRSPGGPGKRSRLVFERAHVL